MQKIPATFDVGLVPQYQRSKLVVETQEVANE